MDMETCYLTKEQVLNLLAGKKIKVEWQTAGEYGWTDSNTLVLIPEKETKT